MAAESEETVEMPVSANPNKREFFVYQFNLGGYPFYVGIGRSKRALDRVRYVRSLLIPKNASKLARSSLSVRVMAELLLLGKGKDIRLSCKPSGLTRRQACALERVIIDRLVRKGILLTNWQYNPHRHSDVNRAVAAMLSKTRTL